MLKKKKKTLISRSTRPNTHESKYQNFRITKSSSFKQIKKKVKKVLEKGFVYVLQIFFIVGERHYKFNSFAFHRDGISSIPF